MKTLKSICITSALMLMPCTALAEVYGGFAVGAAGLQVEDADSHLGVTLKGKVGGRGQDVGGYVSLRGAGANTDVPEVTAGLGQLGGGVDLFIPGGSSLFVELGYSRLTAEADNDTLELGTGVFFALGANILVAHPFNLGLFVNYSGLSTNPVLVQEGLPEGIDATLYGVEAVFQW